MKTLVVLLSISSQKKKKNFFCQYRIRNHNNCVKLKEPKRRKSKYMHGGKLRVEKLGSHGLHTYNTNHNPHDHQITSHAKHYVTSHSFDKFKH